MREVVKIESLANGGDGVAHLSDGRALFVPQTCPGDLAAVELVQSKERFARGVVAELLEPSPARMRPACAEACGAALAGEGTLFEEPRPVCGGCPWSHISYEEQLRWKWQLVFDALNRVGGVPAAELERVMAPACVPSKKQWNYRNKLEFEVGQDAAGRLALGMHSARGGFMQLAACQLGSKKLARAPKALAGALRYALGTAPEVELLRVGLRHSERTGATEVALWTAPGRFPRAQVARVLADSLPVKQLGITRVLLKGTAKERRVSGTEALGGHGAWSENIAGSNMLLSAPSFFQVNTPQAEKLVELVLEGLAVEEGELVLDLYSGAGTFTLPLARAVGSSGCVAAIEAEGSSVRDLRRNLERNNLEAEVIGGDTARELDAFEEADKVVVDPPRAGLSERARAGLLEQGASRIAYVSCDPSTLARDLKAILADGRYHLAQITPVDLFPQTPHVETVVLLSKGESRAKNI